MPAWAQPGGGNLTEDEINDLVGYVLTLPAPAPGLQPVTSANRGPKLVAYLLGGFLFSIVIWFRVRRASH